MDSKITIMLACAAGMSTSLLVTKMQQAAKEQGVTAEIFAIPASEIMDYTEEKHIDVLLLGPQVSYMLSDLKVKFEAESFPIASIPTIDYGMMNGKKVLEFALDKIKEQ